MAGLSTALYLRRAGPDVAVIDPLSPAGGASFGNAGLISPDNRSADRWLMDPLGPLSVRPSYLPRALPWLMRWVELGHLNRVLRPTGRNRCRLARFLGELREGARVVLRITEGEPTDGPSNPNAIRPTQE